jgi:hypothetical protein
MLLSMIPIAIVPFNGMPFNGIASWNGCQPASDGLIGAIYCT